MDKKVPRDKWFLAYLPVNSANGLVSPLAPLFITEILLGGVVEYSLFTIVSSISTIIGLFLWGYLSDKLKKRKIFVVLGFISLGITSVLFGLSPNVLFFLSVSFLSGFLGSAAAPIASVLIMELSERKDWSNKISKFSLYASLGQIIGVLLAAGLSLIFLQSSSLRMLYYIASILYITSGVAAWLLIPESKSMIDRNKVDIRSFRVFEKIRYFPSHIIHWNFKFTNIDKNLRITLISFMIMMMGFQLFFVAFPIQLKEIGVNNTVFFLIYLGNYIFAAITFTFSGQIATKIGYKKVTSLAVITRLIIFPSTTFLIILLHNDKAILFDSLLLVYSLLGALWSFISVGTATLSSNLSKPEQRGVVAGTYNAVQSIGVIVGSSLTGLIVTRYGFSIDFFMADLVVLIGLLLFIRVNDK
jgi:Arabinose efflux permease